MPTYQIDQHGLGKVQVPCLVVKGDRSHPVPMRIADALAEGIPGAELVEVRESGHVTYAEQPAAFAEAVLAFAARLEIETVARYRHSPDAQPGP
jgi:pimeloyl-ACP methyl ester carboxylesterase